MRKTCAIGRKLCHYPNLSYVAMWKHLIIPLSKWDQVFIW